MDTNQHTVGMYKCVSMQRMCKTMNVKSESKKICEHEVHYVKMCSSVNMQKSGTQESVKVCEHVKLFELLKW